MPNNIHFERVSFSLPFFEFILLIASLYIHFFISLCSLFFLIFCICFFLSKKMVVVRCFLFQKMIYSIAFWIPNILPISPVYIMILLRYNSYNIFIIYDLVILFFSQRIEYSSCILLLRYIFMLLLLLVDLPSMIYSNLTVYFNFEHSRLL